MLLLAQKRVVVHAALVHDALTDESLLKQCQFSPPIPGKAILWPCQLTQERTCSNFNGCLLYSGMLQNCFQTKQAEKTRYICFNNYCVNFFIGIVNSFSFRAA